MEVEIFSEFVINAFVLLCVYIVDITALVKPRILGIVRALCKLNIEIHGIILLNTLIHGISDSKCSGKSTDSNEKHEADNCHGSNCGVYLAAELTECEAVETVMIDTLCGHHNSQEHSCY